MSRDTCEESKKLDAAQFARDGWLRPGLSGTSNWTRGGEPSGRIGWRTERDRLLLDYTVTDLQDEKHPYRYAVRVEQTPAGFGGVRTWWRCPNTRCGRRVKVLYLPPFGRYFLCRRCHDLAYRSQNDRQAGYWRLTDRMREIEAVLLDRNQPRRKVIRAGRELDRLDALEWETTPLRAMAARWEAADRRRQARDERRRRGPGRPSKRALREREAAGRRAAKEATAAARPKLPPGRPKEKRAYTRHAPMALATPPAPNVAFCVRCRDRRPLTYRRIVRLSNDRRALQGRCSDCGTKTRRLLPANPIPNG